MSARMWRGAWLVGLCWMALAAPRSQAWAQGRRVAVLELSDGGALPASALRFLSDQVRGAALGAQGADWQVMTRENLLQLMPPDAELAACAEDCEIEIGRAVGADLVVTGQISRIGARYVVALKAHRTAEGRLVAQSSGSGPTVEAIGEALPEIADRLFADLAGPRSVKGPARVPVAVTGPPGLQLKVDGLPVGLTPLAGPLRLAPGLRQLETPENGCFFPWSETVRIEGEGALTLTPQPRTGRVVVQATNPAGEPVDAEVIRGSLLVGRAAQPLTLPVCGDGLLVKGNAGSRYVPVTLVEDELVSLAVQLDERPSRDAAQARAEARSRMVTTGVVVTASSALVGGLSLLAIDQGGGGLVPLFGVVGAGLGLLGGLTSGMVGLFGPDELIQP